MITIYHLNESRSDRIVWLMEELGEPYEIKAYDRLPDMMAPPEYRALHPMGTSPIIGDGDLRLVETGAIVEYILDRYGNGRLQPERGTRAHALYIQWMHFAEGAAAFGILTEAILQGAAAERPKPGRFLQVWRDRNARMMPYLNDEMGQRPYFCGEAFSAADIMMAYSLQMYERFIPRPLSDYPNLVTYAEKVFARPAYVKAMTIIYPESRSGRPGAKA
jgi:glutathione S-transferase